MANFTFNPSVSLTTSDGISLTKSQTGIAANAKLLLDDEFAGSATSVDFAPMIASITNPLWALLRCSGAGANLKFDGAASFTSKAYQWLQFELTPNTPGPSGVLDLELSTNGSVTQRIRFLAVGDPD